MRKHVNREEFSFFCGIEQIYHLNVTDSSFTIKKCVFSWTIFFLWEKIRQKSVSNSKHTHNVFSRLKLKCVSKIGFVRA